MNLPPSSVRISLNDGFCGAVTSARHHPGTSADSSEVLPPNGLYPRISCIVVHNRHNLCIVVTTDREHCLGSARFLECFGTATRCAFVFEHPTNVINLPVRVKPCLFAVARISSSCGSPRISRKAMMSPLVLDAALSPSGSITWPSPQMWRSAYRSVDLVGHRLYLHSLHATSLPSLLS